VIVGTVHSGVALAMAKVAKDKRHPADRAQRRRRRHHRPAVRAQHLPQQLQQLAAGLRHGRGGRAEGLQEGVTITWKYAAGDETVKGFKEAFEKGGGKVVKELNLPFPNVEFQALLTEIAAQKPDVVFAFFAGGGAVKFVKDYDAAGLKKNIPLMARAS
jgi:branched-chain amino acid transport system substrate-binding protein